MKKILLGMAAGAMALGAVAVPASAGTPGDSIWDLVDDGSNDVLSDLVLIAGMATMLDACGNGKPNYTFFGPIEIVFTTPDTGLFDVLGTSLSKLQSAPAVVRGILNDHLVNGSFSSEQLATDELTTLTARSGFTLRNEEGDFINDQAIITDEQACNGYLYDLGGFIDSTPQVPTEGLNSLDTPNDGTPGGTNSLPDTL
jgi:hypothetical protein